jgi:hypothetical protein
MSYSGSVSIVFNIVLELFTRITHNHLEGKSLSVLSSYLTMTLEKIPWKNTR